MNYFDLKHQEEEFQSFYSFFKILFENYFSERAGNVLTSAQDLVKSLNEADEAQQKAKEAIKQANEDISLAKSDLEKVSLHLLFRSSSYFN